MSTITSTFAVNTLSEFENVTDFQATTIAYTNSFSNLWNSYTSNENGASSSYSYFVPLFTYTAQAMYDYTMVGIMETARRRTDIAPYLLGLFSSSALVLGGMFLSSSVATLTGVVLFATTLTGVWEHNAKRKEK